MVTYSDVQKLNDLQCYVTLPGDYPVVKLSMSYEAMPKVADALLLRDVQTSLDQTLEDEIRRRSEEERHKFAGLFEGESLIQAVPGGAFIPEGNLSNTLPFCRPGGCCSRGSEHASCDVAIADKGCFQRCRYRKHGFHCSCR